MLSPSLLLLNQEEPHSLTPQGSAGAKNAGESCLEKEALGSDPLPSPFLVPVVTFLYISLKITVTVSLYVELTTLGFLTGISFMEEQKDLFHSDVFSLKIFKF